MKVYISADMEGITGTVSSQQVLEDGADYHRFRRLMTQDVNAAVAGAFEGGATEVLVNDSHWKMINILIEELDPRARLLSGFHVKPLVMMEGIDTSFDLAFFVGYHAMVGRSHGVMNETFWGREMYELRLNGQPIGELAMNAAIAGVFGVPVGLVTGDDALADEAKTLLGELETVVVKYARDRWAAVCLPPSVTSDRIRDGARRAVERTSEFSPLSIEGPVRFEIEWTSTAEAASAALVPGSERVTPRVVSYIADDYLAAFRGVLACLLLGRTATDMVYG